MAEPKLTGAAALYDELGKKQGRYHAGEGGLWAPGEKNEYGMNKAEVEKRLAQMQAQEEDKRRRGEELAKLKARWAEAKDCPPRLLMNYLEDSAFKNSDHRKSNLGKATQIFDDVPDDEHRADLCSFPGAHGKLILHVAMDSAAPIELVQRIIQANPQAASVADEHGWLPLHYAARRHMTFDYSERDDERYVHNVRACLEAFPEAVRAWTVVGVEGPPVAGGPGFPVKLPLHLAVEALRSARFQSTASAVTVVELLLAAYPEGAQQTGYPKVSLAGKPFGFDHAKRNLPINLVFDREGEMDKDNPQCKAVHELLKAHSPKGWEIKGAGGCVVA